MFSVSTARAAPASARRSPWGNDRLGSSISPSPNIPPTISATLTGSSGCEALGMVMTDHAPVLAFCGELRAASLVHFFAGKGRL
jgi:hypothetical protein